MGLSLWYQTAHVTFVDPRSGEERLSEQSPWSVPSVNLSPKREQENHDPGVSDSTPG